MIVQSQKRQGLVPTISAQPAPKINGAPISVAKPPAPAIPQPAGAPLPAATTKMTTQGLAGAANVPDIPAPQPAAPQNQGQQPTQGANQGRPAQQPGVATTDPAQSTDTLAQVSRVIASDSPLMRLAETQGKTLAARRGLLSSSMAVNAAQDAVLAAATPIGSQTAAQYAQMQMKDKDIAAQFGLQANDIEATRQNLLTQIQSTEGMQDKDIAAQREAQIRDIQSKFGLQKKDAEALMDRLTTELKANKELAKMNLTASDRESATSMIQNITSNYETALANINANTKLKATDRQKQIEALNARREKQYKLVREMYDIDISWPANAPASTGGQQNNGGQQNGGANNGGSPTTSTAPRYGSAQWVAQLKPGTSAYNSWYGLGH